MGDEDFGENDFELVEEDDFISENDSYSGSIGSERLGKRGSYIEGSSLDIRKFPKEAFSLVSSAFSVDKTIRKIYKTKTTYREKQVGRSENDADAKVGIIKSSGSRGGKRQDKFDMKALSDYEKFKLQTWMSFNKFSIKFNDDGEFFDGCTQGVPIDQILNAMWLISDFHSQDELLAKIKERCYATNSVLSWTEFRDLVKDVFYPFLLLLSKNYAEYITHEQLYLADTTLNPAMLGYQRALEKARYSKSRSGLQCDSDNDSTMSNSSNHSVISADTMQIGDKMAPRSVLCDKILSAVRKNYRCGDKDYEKNLQPIDRPKPPEKMNKKKMKENKAQKPGDHDSEVAIEDEVELDKKDESESVKPNKAASPTTSNVKKAPRKRRSKDKSTLFLELQKKKIADICDPQQNYSTLWHEMKEKRDDERVKSNVVKIVKNEMLSTLHRVCYIDEKDRLNSVINDMKQEHRNNKITQAERNREKEDAMIENWETIKRKIVINKSKYKQELDKSLQDGVGAARAQIEAERNEKRLMRESSIKRLDSTTSSVVPIPENLKEFVKTAKSYKEFTDGKAAIKKYYENTMDSRISTLKKSRSEAILDSKFASTYQISISPLRSSEFFSESECFTPGKDLPDLRLTQSQGKLTTVTSLSSKSKPHTLSPLKSKQFNLSFNLNKSQDASECEKTPSPYRAEDSENNLSYDSILTEYLDNSYYSEGDYSFTDECSTVPGAIDVTALNQGGYLQDTALSPIKIKKISSPLSTLRNNFKGAEFRKKITDPKANKVELKIAIGNGRQIFQHILEKPKPRDSLDSRVVYDIRERIVGEDITEAKYIASVHKKWSKLPEINTLC